MAVPTKQVEGYAKLAVQLLLEYLDIDLSENLDPSATRTARRPSALIPETSEDSVIASAEARSLVWKISCRTLTKSEHSSHIPKYWRF